MRKWFSLTGMPGQSNANQEVAQTLGFKWGLRGFLENNLLVLVMQNARVWDPTRSGSNASEFAFWWNTCISLNVPIYTYTKMECGV